MDKNAIKKYAVWARNELIARVTQKAQQYGITADDIVDANADSINGNLLTATEKKQRQALIKKIEVEGFEQVMEEVAYTWFNRFTALRFMEINNYLPSHVRVFTNDDNEFKPQILAEAINLELDGLDMDKVFELKDANKDEELYKYLLIVQCNALNEILPRMFQKIADYSELLLPDYLLREGSVIEEMISEIPETDWTDQVQIIGWLYQYYNSEPKDKLINAKKQYKDQDIPFVTQLFTSDWIVRYMVQNTIGRLWLETHDDKSLESDMEFYLKNSINIDNTNVSLTPEMMTCIDPCMGSGHILVYAFDLLMKIYENYGYSTKEAVEAIIEKNLYGLDIDDRATQLAYFAIMMKARQYDRRFFTRGLQPNIYKLENSNKLDQSFINYFVGEDTIIQKNMSNLCDSMQNANEFGSLIEIGDVDFELLYKRADEIICEQNLFSSYTENVIIPFIKCAEVLSKKYMLVVSNPPYMATKYMTKNIKEYVTKEYADYKADLFAVFLVKFSKMCLKEGQIGVLTPYVWMFIQSYEKLRNYIYANMTFTSLVQLEFNAFEAACVPVAAFTFRNKVTDIPFECVRLSEFKGIEEQEPKTLEAVKNPDCGYRFTAHQSDFVKIPGNPVAYWASEQMIKTFENTKLGDLAKPRQGMATSDNNRFLRAWYEVEGRKIFYNAHNTDEAKQSGAKWFPYNKGGGYRKWYGNNEFLVNWENDGAEIKAYATELYGCVTRTIKNIQFYFNDSITWTFIAITPGFRYCDYGFAFDVAGSSIFIDDNIKIYTLGFLCSCVSNQMLGILNPTMNLQANDIKALPLLIDESKKEDIESLVIENITISKEDWDFSETSWDFESHPLVGDYKLILEAFNEWENICEKRYNRLVENEYRINQLFISIYGLEDVLNPDVNNDEITIQKADKTREVKSLIMYAVGCMFGRYSLDQKGVVNSGEEIDFSKYVKYQIDSDNIIPICDDEYFEDDIVGLFIKFIEVIYGDDYLEENLQFIADALGGKGTSREVIRNYFISDFYKDHCKIYQKRPIYWMFESGKKNGFKCLVYMHRYKSDTIARIRTDYVHEQQSRYRTMISDIEQRLNSASTSERVKLNKQLKKVNDQAEELRLYEEKIHHLADQMIDIDLDDGVKVNYAKFQDVLAKIK